MDTRRSAPLPPYETDHQPSASPAQTACSGAIPTAGIRLHQMNMRPLFYLGILGPSAVVAARRLAAWLEASPEGFAVPPAVLARQLGLGTGTGRNAPLTKTLTRLAGFGLAAVRDDAYAMRLAFPPLNPRQVRRLPPHLVQAHGRFGDGLPDRPTGSATVIEPAR